MIKKICIVILIIMFLAGIYLFIFFEKKQNEKNVKEEEKIEEIKNEYGFEGDKDLYEIQEDDNNVEILTVKPSIKFMVAYSGMIEKNITSIKQVEKIFEKNYNYKNGIYIEKDSRKTFLEWTKTQSFKNKYFIDSEGYLKVEEESKLATEYDNILVKEINSEFNYIIDISNICYIIDDVSGEIMDYNFAEMDKYQVYESFVDTNKMIIFVTENNLLSENEIIESVVLAMDIK